jgi:hypothetical protein
MIYIGNNEFRTAKSQIYLGNAGISLFFIITVIRLLNLIKSTEQEMTKKLGYLVAVAFLAAPTFASADPVAASLSASFGKDFGTVIVAPPSGSLARVTAPISVSVAGASGDFAVATSVATAKSSGAASGATNNSDLPPMVAFEYNNVSNAYETSVMFTPVVDAAAIAANICNSGFSATQLTSAGNLIDTGVTTPTFAGITLDGSVDNGAVSITNGDITVTCN